MHYFEAKEKKNTQSFILSLSLLCIRTEAWLPLTKPDPSRFNSKNISVPKILQSKPGDYSYIKAEKWRAYGNSQHDKWQFQFWLHSHHLQTLENYQYFLLFIYQPIFVALTGGIINRLTSSACLNLSYRDEQETMPIWTSCHCLKKKKKCWKFPGQWWETKSGVKKQIGNIFYVEYKVHCCNYKKYKLSILREQSIKIYFKHLQIKSVR